MTWKDKPCANSMARHAWAMAASSGLTHNKMREDIEGGIQAESLWWD
jgi:hypothetical protein